MLRLIFDIILFIPKLVVNIILLIPRLIWKILVNHKARIWGFGEPPKKKGKEE